MLQKYGLNAARIVVAFIMLAGGGAKLAGIPAMHDSFATLGLPSWFGYFIGACEVAGAIGIFINPLSALAALGISIIMLGAIYYHVMYTPLVEGIASLLVFLLCIYIIIKQKSKLFKFGST